MIQKVAAVYLTALFVAWMVWAVNVNGMQAVLSGLLIVGFIASILIAIAALFTD